MFIIMRDSDIGKFLFLNYSHWKHNSVCITCCTYKDKGSDSFKLTVNSVNVLQVRHTKFLVITIDSNLRWNVHIKELMKNCRN